jgi:hypothetical protein
MIDAITGLRAFEFFFIFLKFILLFQPSFEVSWLNTSQQDSLLNIMTQ